MKWMIALSVVLLSLVPCSAQKMTDREFSGLKGDVKLVSESEQKLSPETGKEEPTTDTEYAKVGNELQKTNHFFGSRTIYFVLDGAKVSRSEKFAESKFKLESIATIVGSSDTAPTSKEKAKPSNVRKTDERFEYRYEYKYDARGRIVREIQYTNTGERDDDTEYVYDKVGHLAAETKKIPGQGTFKDTYRYDSNGMLVENTAIFYTESGARQFTLSYTYSDYKLDGNGNWIERKEAVKHADEPNEIPKVTVQRRRITYF